MAFFSDNSAQSRSGNRESAQDRQDADAEQAGSPAVSAAGLRKATGLAPDNDGLLRRIETQLGSVM